MDAPFAVSKSILDKFLRDRVFFYQRHKVSLASEHHNCDIIATMCESIVILRLVDTMS